MTKKDLSYISIGVSFFITLFSGICILYAFDYVLDTKYYKQPSIPKPAKGTPFVDQIFRTTITRVTDKATDYPGGDYILTEYDVISSANANDTYIIGYESTPSSNYRILFQGPANATPYQKFRVLTVGAKGGSPGIFCNNAQSPIWHSTDPDKIFVIGDKHYQGGSYVKDGPKLYVYRVSTDSLTLVHDFTKDPGISKFFAKQQNNDWHYIDWEEYNEPSKDMRYWAFGIYRYSAAGTQLKAAFIYDMTLNSVLNWTEDPTKIYIDNNKGMLRMSPSGNYIVASANPQGVGENHIHIYDRNWNYLSEFHGGHSDMGLDAEGRDIIVGQLFAKGYGDDYLAWVDLADGTVYGAIQNVSSHHVSAHTFTKPGWAFFNTYETQTGWAIEQIFAVELNRNKAIYKVTWPGLVRTYPTPDNPCRVLRIAHHHIYTIGGAYINQAHGSVSLSGNYFYYGGRWENSSDSPEIYQVTLPPTWYQDLKGNIQTKSDTIPPAIPTGIKVLK